MIATVVDDLPNMLKRLGFIGFIGFIGCTGFRGLGFRV